MTPSLPTTSMASEIFLPICGSEAEMVPTEAICSLVSTVLGGVLHGGRQRRRRPCRCRGGWRCGLAPAATLRRPSFTMTWASSVAVVVPSPTVSLVLVATSLTSWAPMFSTWSFELDLLGDGDAVVGDGGGAVGALEGNVATLGAHGGGHGVGEGVDALGELGAGIGAERECP